MATIADYIDNQTSFAVKVATDGVTNTYIAWISPSDILSEDGGLTAYIGRNTQLFSNRELFGTGALVKAVASTGDNLGFNVVSVVKAEDIETVLELEVINELYPD